MTLRSPKSRFDIFFNNDLIIAYELNKVETPISCIVKYKKRLFYLER